MTPTEADLKRDLTADLALCDTATRGPWYVVDTPWLPPDCAPYAVAGNPDPHVGVNVLDSPEIDEWPAEQDGPDYSQHWTDLKFACTARTGWPAAIRRALAAEAERDRLSMMHHEAAADRDRLERDNNRLRTLLRVAESAEDERRRYLADLREIGRLIGCDHPHDGHARCVRQELDRLRAQVEWHARRIAEQSELLSRRAEGESAPPADDDVAGRDGPYE